MKGMRPPCGIAVDPSESAAVNQDMKADLSAIMREYWRKRIRLGMECSGRSGEAYIEICNTKSMFYPPGGVDQERGLGSGPGGRR